jgi:hypothetical protein
MLPDLVVAVFLVVCQAVFYSANLYNLFEFRRSKKGAKYNAEVGSLTSLCLPLPLSAHLPSS